MVCSAMPLSRWRIICLRLLIVIVFPAILYGVSSPAKQTITEKIHVVNMARMTVVKITGIRSLDSQISPQKGVVNIIGKKWSTSPEQVVKMDRNIQKENKYYLL